MHISSISPQCTQNKHKFNFYTRLSRLQYRLVSTCLVFCLLLLSEPRAEQVNDFSRLNPVTVEGVIRVTSVDDIIDGVKEARARGLSLSIAAKRNSQGGHTAKAGALVLDMSGYNQVLRLNQTAKTITVQSGITWGQIQETINPHKLAVKVMQSSNIFSVGGSLSANVHGRDPRFGPIVETVMEFRIVLSDGEEVSVSRQQNKDLFYAVIGGYGVFGVITSVKLSLTDNVLLEKSVVPLSYENYVGHLQNRLSDKLALHYGRCSIVKDDSFFRDCVAVDYIEKGTTSGDELIEEQNVYRDKWFMGLSRQYEWGKSLRWWLQGKLIDRPGQTQLLSRNNAMRPPIRFLQYYSEEDTDMLQEYFVPPQQFIDFMDELRGILLKHKVNLLSMTLRYVPKSQPVLLNYAPEDSLAIVLYINVKLGRESLDHVQSWTRLMVDKVKQYGGKYYLTYQRFPTVTQMRETYPAWQQFNQLKQQLDPKTLFNSAFYQHYFLIQL